MERKIFQDACATFCVPEQENEYIYECFLELFSSQQIGYSKHLSEFQNRMELINAYSTAFEGTLRQPPARRLQYVNAIRQDLGMRAYVLPAPKKETWVRTFLDIIDSTLFNEVRAIIPPYLVYRPVIVGSTIDIKTFNELPSDCDILRGLPKRITTLSELEEFNSVTQATPPSKDLSFRNRQKKWKAEVQRQTTILRFAVQCNSFLEKKVPDKVLDIALGKRPIDAPQLGISAFSLACLKTYTTGRPPDDNFHCAPSPELARILRAL